MLFVIWLVGESFILVLIGGLLAYIMYPFVLLFQRVMPRPLAIFLVYLLLLVALIRTRLSGGCFLRATISRSYSQFVTQLFRP